ncbi:MULTISPECIES: potassium-transporting ATPase subunit KdpC [Alcaligenes]|uniref:Potassium-transporting ATPase KdpC subunit n=2 Tax=Alcaligenes TaxID=507 RepID=A0AB33CRR9_ALCFA|nr:MULTISPECIES: potassium-transporting ATPase subunit KdpC [Alcaligenes]ASR89265.1 potassium-transporting ATPase subunit C [Alcaligenes faecalis]AWG34174.1 potassium-transporting ATPase subunit C [Alcaligenes aquatilis]MCC9163097.1 potassium-transporting ATPase subunit KdpC [Alcaligenes sp. MMA]QXR37359.1 potassium-transporting ATPase subunit KdpC [Alcaligenes aquatilis]UQN37384.1 potassium-transporting ATPase subunit KdpC [Alcaligenes aquatilis]
MSTHQFMVSTPVAPTVKSLLRPVLLSAVFFMLLTGIAYPLATTVIGTALFPEQANGSLIERDGQVVGSRQIGQYFSQPEYFHGRPSVTLGVDPSDPSNSISQPYNAAASGGSNQGALSKNLLNAVAERSKAYRLMNGLAEDAPVPVDAVTASASGLDPHISVANARLQAARIARVRGMSLEQVLALIDRYTHARQLGVLGEPRVQVLELNLALDMAKSVQPVVR